MGHPSIADHQDSGARFLHASTLLPPSVHWAAHARAAKLGITLGDWIRRAVERDLQTTWMRGCDE